MPFFEEFRKNLKPKFTPMQRYARFLIRQYSKGCFKVKIPKRNFYTEEQHREMYEREHL